MAERRQQQAKRYSFTAEERKEILRYSNGRCAHCGKELSAYSYDYSVEHIIPISRGGTNDRENLIALCFDCNQDKSNNVVNPADYYKYADKEFLEKVIEKYKLYQQKTCWLERGVFTKEDAFEIKVRLSQKSKLELPVGVLRKSTLEDLDDVYKFTQDYHDKFGITKEGLKDVINQRFKAGAIYTIKGPSGIIAVLPFMTDLEPLIVDNKPRYFINICGIPCKYQKHNNEIAIYKALQRVMTEFCEISPNNEVVMEIMAPSNDHFLLGILDDLNPQYAANCSEGFEARLFIQTLDDKGRLKEVEGIENEVKREKVIERFSTFLQRELGFKKIEDKKKVNNIKELSGHGKKKRRA